MLNLVRCARTTRGGFTSFLRPTISGRGKPRTPARFPNIGYNAAMTARKKQPKPRPKQPYPSYEEGDLRDKSIEEKMDPEYERKDLRRLIKKGVKRPS